MGIKELASEIQERKTRKAREASIESKLLDGPRLFKLSCEAIKAGLRIDHPEATEEESKRNKIPLLCSGFNYVTLSL